MDYLIEAAKLAGIWTAVALVLAPLAGSFLATNRTSDSHPSHPHADRRQRAA